MTVQDERWRFVVVYANGRREGEEAASYPLIGLDERAVCRMFGFKGSHVPSLPVEVRHDDIELVQPYAAATIRMPKGTRGELWLDRDASSGRDLVPLAIFTAIAVVAAIGAWAFGNRLHGWLSPLLHLVAVLLALVAAWSLVSTLLVVGVVRAQRREGRESRIRGLGRRR